MVPPTSKNWLKKRLTVKEESDSESSQTSVVRNKDGGGDV